MTREQMLARIDLELARLAALSERERAELNRALEQAHQQRELTRKLFGG